MKVPSYYCESRPEIASLVPESIKTILDIGCGEGAFLKLVKELTGAETWGIEVSVIVAGKAKKQVDKIITANVETVSGSIPDGYFDCITLNDVLEHLQEPSDVLKILKSKLSEKGIIIASIPNVRYYSNLYELIVKRDWEYREAGILDSTHLRFFTKRSMKRMFEEAGYTLSEQVGINKSISWKSKLFQILSFGIFYDTKYLQFVCIAKIDIKKV